MDAGISLLICNPRFAAFSKAVILSNSVSAFLSTYYLHITLANHPAIHTPPAATSWASCLFAVDENNDKDKLRYAQVINCGLCKLMDEKKTA